MPDRSTGPTVAEPLTQLLTRAAHAVTAQVERVLKPEGLTIDQWLVIEALATRKGLTMAALADQTAATGPTLTRVVDRLVTTATVYREVDPADRRKVRVYLSPRGRATHKRVAAKVRGIEQVVLERAGDPAAIAALLTDLRACPGSR
ncbi:MarR family winged helix-turn-helix transcriptional regulator [Kibdelosporangium phytohabitans]|uniref:MarR family transcriptional regulator n=1 Tax=Kibdelosporangium phytohabitans TaxID=860235 RepID=A0A0N9IE00_9PSEU|nr:MarR family transcriptional regulator [Kibdelosporangium phytohabitans]ALG12996.1 MarR family transcriptional regulator [Kibdelosporangium phytohabitans]MBE1464718.1 DNA-binding MarR family transcriptional regulator [Kibdelosporangium phytohabitans]